MHSHGMSASVTVLTRPRRLLRGSRREALFGYLFISPWIVGFLCLQLGPILASFGISLTDWTLLEPPHFIGLDNYRRLAADPLVRTSLRVTLIYTAISVPTGIALALLAAALLNRAMRGITFFRTLFYLPVVISGVGTAMVWGWIFNPEYGILNAILSLLGVPGPDWLADSSWALPALIILSQWGIGGAIVVFLAALKGVPQTLYEAAALDGAGRVSAFWNVTVPMISPAILFNAIMSVIASFQTFTYAYILTSGGPNNATLFYMLYLYQNAFRWFDMGYASALAWILFLMILSCTLLILWLSRSRVHYEGGPR